MATLSVEKQTIFRLFSDKNSDFLIPDYQRPYAWDETECRTLWDDLFQFAFPENNYENFKKGDEYFLGPIVTFKNNEKLEIIDGQQRLTTLMLLLRAFYTNFSYMQDTPSKNIREDIEKCIWKSGELGELLTDELKIESLVSTDEDKEEFKQILKSGILKDEYKSKYAIVFRFFKDKISDLLRDYPSYYAYLPARIMNNCILLPIEAENQDTALRIFSTLNNRGLPLSDSDIFKSELYKIYSKLGKKDEFIKEWKELDVLCERIFHPATGTSLDELFTRYMYYERAKRRNKLSTTEGLRKFYEKNDYSILKKEETFENLKLLADFWNSVSCQDKDRFSDEVLRKLFILNYAPNSMWTYITSVYFMAKKDCSSNLENTEFSNFLSKLIAFTWAYAITNPGVNALRTPVFAEMINIIDGKRVTFSDYKFSVQNIKLLFNEFKFLNNRPITKSMIAWWMMQSAEQDIPKIDTTFEIEHIYSKKRLAIDPVSDSQIIESIGNKALLEKRINIRASDYRIADKIKYYKGHTTTRKQKVEPTINRELRSFSEATQFTESDILNRKNAIINLFIDYLRSNELVNE